MQIPAPNDREFELPPAGTHLAVCYRVLDLGTQDTSYNGLPKRQHKILLSWELPEEKMADGRPFSISQRYTWSMSEKAALRHHLESWRGKPFEARDFGENGFDIKGIIGVGCLLNIVHVARNGKTYANIASIAKLMKNQTAPPLYNEKAYLWINLERWDAAVFHNLKARLRDDIMKSPQYHELIASLDNNMPPDPPFGEADDAHREIPF